MLTHPTHERLIALGLPGMAKAFEEQRGSPDLGALSFEERVGIMADREAAERDTRKLTTRLKFASLRQNACVEDIDLPSFFAELGRVWQNRAERQAMSDVSSGDARRVQRGARVLERIPVFDAVLRTPSVAPTSCESRSVTSYAMK